MSAEKDRERILDIIIDKLDKIEDESKRTREELNQYRGDMKWAFRIGNGIVLAISVVVSWAINFFTKH